MVMGLLAPEWALKTTTDFTELLNDWETAVGEYERQSTELISDNIRNAVILKHTPQDIKSAVRMSMGAVQRDYTRMKEVILECCASGRTYGKGGARNDDGPVPMEVDNVNRPWGKDGWQGQCHQQGGWW